MRPEFRQAQFEHLAQAREAKFAMLKAQRVKNAPRVRDLHAQGLCVQAIARDAGLSAKYVKSLLAEMGLTRHPSPCGRPPQPAATPGEDLLPAPVPDDGRALRKALAQACVAHFRDLVEAYPGRKLASLAFRETYSPTRFSPPVAASFSSQAALCLEGATAVFR